MARFNPSFSFWPRPQFLGSSPFAFSTWINNRNASHAKAVPLAEEGWLGFICKECGAPLAVHQSASTSETPVSTRGWRVACTGCGVTSYYELGTAMVRITVG